MHFFTAQKNTSTKGGFTRHGKSENYSGGFTLIEMLVALVIFSMVMLVAIGSLVSIIEANRKARNEKVIVNNINAAVENMSRQIREGTQYASADPSTFSFTSQEGDTITYSLSTDNQLIRSEDNGASYLPITSPSVVIDTLEFDFISSGTGSQQPKVLITLSGSTGEQDRTRSYFNLQTTVSQRYTPSTEEVYTSDVTPIPVCPYTQSTGRSIVNFSQIKQPGQSILGKTCCQKRITYDLAPAAQIPPGTYSIGLVPWDDHCNAAGNCAVGQKHSNQDGEHIFMELFDSSGVMLHRTLPTAIDIPNDKSLVIPPEIVSQGVTLNNTVTRIVVGHGAVHPTNPSGGGNNPQSVVPACAMFDNGASGNVDIQPF